MITQKLVGTIIVVLGVVGGGALFVKYEISSNSVSSVVSAPVVNIPTPAYYEVRLYQPKTATFDLIVIPPCLVRRSWRPTMERSAAGS